VSSAATPSLLPQPVIIPTTPTRVPVPVAEATPTPPQNRKPVQVDQVTPLLHSTGRYRARAPRVFRRNAKSASTARYHPHHPNARSCPGGRNHTHPASKQEAPPRRQSHAPAPPGHAAASRFPSRPTRHRVVPTQSPLPPNIPLRQNVPTRDGIAPEHPVYSAATPSQLPQPVINPTTPTRVPVPVAEATPTPPQNRKPLQDDQVTPLLHRDMLPP